MHGFTGTPSEVALVVEVSERLGIRAEAPLLPGHGTHARDLAPTRYPDWLAEAEESLASMTQDGSQVVVAGLSLGTLLTLDLALRHPDKVKAVCLLSNAVWLKAPFPAWALGAADFLGLPDIWFPKPEGPDLGEPSARESHLTYNSQPSRAAREVFRAGRRLRKRLGEVSCPALIVHGQNDRVCPVSNARGVARRLGSRDVEVKILHRSHHILTRDWDKDEAAKTIARFLTRFTPGS